MRKRNISILFRLTRREAEQLDKQVKKSGLSREAYLRQLAAGLRPRDTPPPDYYAMMRQLYRVGEELSRISGTGSGLDALEQAQYTQAVRLFEQTVRQMTEAVVLPEKL